MKIANNMVYFGNARFTVLSEGLLRLEYSLSKQFVDQPSQKVVQREFPDVHFQAMLKNGHLWLETDRYRVIYNGKEFSPSALSIELKGNYSEYCNVWHYGEPTKNLGGTARTLDGCDGACPLDDGIFSQYGYSVIDDSSSYIFQGDTFQPRKDCSIDKYYFGFGTDYLEGLKAFYQLCGFPPLLPRFALGNWWSRYYPYSDQEYLALMNRFADEKVPFSIAVLDMDWHKVNIDEKYGSGWTGYSWNQTLFPSPVQFLQEMHERGIKVALNDHPSGGVRAFEVGYERLAEALQFDPKDESPILFDPSSPEFMKQFQKCILDPLESAGIDFWWIDWQQGTISRLAGLDPLWVLNYTRFHAGEKQNKRSLILSRYAGIGSHRYPIGFSGDTIISWKSLEFQPYFTLTSSNIGFGWWSHDIGGHMQGVKDEELHIRWVQFGVFSPIMRLHSTSNDFSGKEPWRFGEEAHKTINSFLRLRHSLLPYIYSMNYISHTEGIPLVRPLYYKFPNEKESYTVKNEYYFGDYLIVAPIVKKSSPIVQMSRADCWIPPGVFYDFFTGLRYYGPKRVAMFRTITNIPVLVPAGALIVQSEEYDANSNPGSLIINCYAGEDGKFSLYEDDNISKDYQKGIFTKTEFTFSWSKKHLHIAPVKIVSYLPQVRSYTIKLFGVSEGQAKLYSEGIPSTLVITYDKKKHCLQLVTGKLPVDKELEIVFDDFVQIQPNDIKTELYEILNRATIDYDLKDWLYQLYCSKESAVSILYEMVRIGLDEELVLAISEILGSE